MFTVAITVYSVVTLETLCKHNAAFITPIMTKITNIGYIANIGYNDNVLSFGLR